MKHTILDIVVETNAGGTIHHMTITDYDKKYTICMPDRERALSTMRGEVQFILLDLDIGKIVRVYDTFDMSVTDFTKS